MPPKKRAAAGKRALSPVPESETASGSRETRSRSKRPRFANPSPEPEDEFDLNKELEKNINEVERRNGGYGPRGGCPGPIWSTATLMERENRGWQATKKDLTDEETLDWYMDAALEEIKGVMRLAGEDKLRQGDLWNLLTFGQQMYAGIKQFYDVDLNEALLEKERENMRKGVALAPTDLPWPRPAPKRCGSCSRVGTTYVTPEHPWNRPSFDRLYPEEVRYEPIRQSGYDRRIRAPSSFTYPERMGTTYLGINAYPSEIV